MQRLAAAYGWQPDISDEEIWSTAGSQPNQDTHPELNRSCRGSRPSPALCAYHHLQAGQPPAAGRGPAGGAVRGRDATAACGCHTDTCAGTLTVRPGASVLAGAEVRHMARQPRCGLGVKMALGAMPRVTRAWCSRRGCCGRTASVTGHRDHQRSFGVARGSRFLTYSQRLIKATEAKPTVYRRRYGSKGARSCCQARRRPAAQ